MSEPFQTPSIGAAELQKLLTDVDRAALLVPPRLLRRIIKQDCAIGGVGWQVPHRKTYTIGREALLAIAGRDELGLTTHRELPDHLLLLACPDIWLGRHSREQSLVRFWRLLFHSRLDRAVEGLIESGKLDDARIRRTIQQLGTVECEEVFRVLRHENFLLPPMDLRVCFTELVSLFFELRYFARPLLHRYFPSFEDLARAETILKELVDADRVFRETRLAGSPEPVHTDSNGEDEPMDEGAEKLPPPSGMPSAEKCRALLEAADAAAARGNVVRSAILRLRASDVAPPEEIEIARQGALADIERLVQRLQAALELHDREAEEWRAALPALVGPASRGLWPPSARMLYDLQKVCIDYERDLYALDLVEWAVSLARKPIKRAVPLQADVLLVKHLRSAASRLAKTRLGDEDRRRLSILLRAATHHCEERTREKIRPILTESLESVGFSPETQGERVALRKIVEELLDRITERGFLTMGDLRDSVSRNQVKLEDATPTDMILGDKLLKANRKLAITLDGVYRRGEIYLRGLQRFSSGLFGTVLGRLLTLYFIIPFGGAFALLVFGQEMVHIGKATAGLFIPKPVEHAHPPPEEPTDEELISYYNIDPDDVEETQELIAEGYKLPAHKKHEGLPPVEAIAVVGVFLLLVMHVPPFRQRTWQVTRWVAHWLHVVLIDWPSAFFELPAVRQFFESTPMVFFRRRLLFPLLLAIAAYLLCARFGIPGPFDDLAAFGITFILAFLLLGSRLGRMAEEAATDWLARNWYWLRVDALPGVIGLIIWAFKEAMDRIERVLYTVDELLRFRPGDRRIGLIYKPVLGLFWFFFTYGVRVVINLFVEPTVNPIKHFPAVTVGAKMIIPMIPAWSAAMTAVFKPFMGIWLAGFLAGTIVVLLPGICGFAVWEFKENWKLYRANRSRRLRKVMIGHHGESMLRFMKPGFHSGTLPKLFAKLRKAERHCDGRKIHKHHENLHHAAESIRHFVEREMIFLLEDSKSWGGMPLHVGELKLATNRVRVELRCPALDETGLWLCFDERWGWLMASVQKPGWLAKLNTAQSAAFQTALAGLYKLAGAHLVREQLEEQLPACTPYTITPRGLVLFPGGDFAKEEVVSLVEPTEGAVPLNGAPLLMLDRVLYERTPIEWNEWVAAWEADREGKVPSVPLLQSVRVLPRPEPSESLAPGLAAV